MYISIFSEGLYLFFSSVYNKRMENLREQFGNYTVYTENYFRMWKKIEENLVASLKNAGFRIVTARSEKELDSIKETYDRNGIFLYPLKAIAVSYYDDLLSARSRCFNALGNYAERIEQIASLSVTEGTDSDGRFIGGVITEKEKWIVGAEIRLECSDRRWKVTEVYTDEILEAVESMADRLRLISPELARYPFGIVLTDSKDPESLKLAKAFEKNKGAFLPETSIGVKEMYKKIELEGIASVIEIRKHGKLRYRNLLSGAMEICNEEDIETCVKRDSPLIFGKILSESVAFSLRCEHLYLCERCLKNEKRFWVRPFRQRTMRKKCARCDCPAESEIFFSSYITK